jgi:tRNA(Ile)-lysidine synthase
MTALESRVLKYIKDFDLFNTCSSAILGVSGGPDSIALLHLLTTLLPDCSFIGVYVNHNLRPAEADKELVFVRDRCAELGVDFDSVSIDVLAWAKENHRSVEDSARHLRYRALESIRLQRNAQLIAVGHTRDDQVEQFFIRLIRGSGLKGLGGMAPRQDRLVRPLLACAKSDILAYLEEKGSGYCTDSSNTSRRYLRNRIRLGLLPVLEEDYNRSIRRTIRNTMSLIQDEDDYMETLVQQLYGELVHTHRFVEGDQEREEVHVPGQQLLDLHPAIRRRIVEKMFWSVGCPPTFKNIETIIQMTQRGKTGSARDFSSKCTAIKTSDSILLTTLPALSRSGRQEAHRFIDTITIDGPGRYLLPSLGLELVLTESSPSRTTASDDFRFDADRAPFPLIVRAPEPGESFRPLGAPGRKRVSRILSDKKIPRHLRYRFPVISAGGQVIGLLGLVVSDDCKIESSTRRCVRVTMHRK